MTRGPLCISQDAQIGRIARYFKSLLVNVNAYIRFPGLEQMQLEASL